jgi:two-component system, chemotaxis family, protein-glutamate methylesterase/glutaminase
MIKVLVVDDSALMRKLLGRVLADVSDFEVHFARNGMEGLEKLATVNPDVITLDIHMPGMDGLACLDRIMIGHRARPVDDLWIRKAVGWFCADR